MKLDDPFLGKAQVHALRVLQVEGTLVELGDGVVGVQQRRLLVHLPNDLRGNKKSVMCGESSDSELICGEIGQKLNIKMTKGQRLVGA